MDDPSLPSSPRFRPSTTSPPVLSSTAPHQPQHRHYRYSAAATLEKIRSIGSDLPESEIRNDHIDEELLSRWRRKRIEKGVYRDRKPGERKRAPVISHDVEVFFEAEFSGGAAADATPSKRPPFGTEKSGTRRLSPRLPIVRVRGGGGGILRTRIPSRPTEHGDETIVPVQCFAWPRCRRPLVLTQTNGAVPIVSGPDGAGMGRPKPRWAPKWTGPRYVHDCSSSNSLCGVRDELTMEASTQTQRVRVRPVPRPEFDGSVFYSTTAAAAPTLFRTRNHLGPLGLTALARTQRLHGQLGRTDFDWNAETQARSELS